MFNHRVYLRAHRVHTAALFACAVTAAGTTARAQFMEPGNHRTQVEFEAHLVANGSYYYYGTGYGIGARVNIPLGRNGFLARYNNSLALGLGADLVYNADARYKSAGLEAPVVIQWNLHVAPAWTIFFEPGVFVSVLFDTGHCAASDCNGFYIIPEFAAGVRWHFTSSQSFPALVIRVGWPSGLNVGVSF